MPADKETRARPCAGWKRVPAGAGQCLHALGVLGGHIGKQFDHDNAVLQRHDDRVFGVLDLGHRLGLLGWVGRNVMGLRGKEKGKAA